MHPTYIGIRFTTAGYEHEPIAPGLPLDYYDAIIVLRWQAHVLMARDDEYKEACTGQMLDALTVHYKAESEFRDGKPT